MSDPRDAAITRRHLLRLSVAAATAAALPACVGGPAAVTPRPPLVARPRARAARGPRRVIDYTRAKARPTVCFGCTTQCHVLGWVQDGRVVRISGNPIDPNGRGAICSKANGIIDGSYYPGRLLYPLKRVGARGAGKWERITWDEALDLLAARLRALIADGRPDKFAIQVGRDKTQGLTQRFLRTVGSPHGLNRRSICSSNNRIGYMSYFGTIVDWGTPDLERTSYVLNFGSNIMEAHQGGFGAIRRIQDARVDRGAKLVTFEVRPSATASVSDEYFAVTPGSDGAIAMAMAHVIVEEGLADRAFWDRWCNLPFEGLREHLAPFTPALAERESGVPAADVRRLALEFARAAPRCTTLLNRGIAKHYNGMHACRAVVLLDILVGNVGKPGGFSIVNRAMWSGKWGQWGLPRLSPPAPSPPAPPRWRPGMAPFDELPDHVKASYDRLPEAWKEKYQGELITPVDYPLSWQWQVMRVGQLNYPWLREGRAKLDTLLTYVFNGAYSYPEAKVCRDVLADEGLVPFHACVDIAYSETAALADLILPEATALERWDAQATNAWDLVPLTAIRQPLVAPPGEARSVWWIYQQLARRLGPEAYAFWDFPDEEAYYRAWYAALPISWEELKRRGVWWDAARERDYELFERAVPEGELEGAEVDATTGVIRKDGASIGVMIDGKAVRGFPSPSGRIEVHQPLFEVAARVVGLQDEPIASPMPTFFRVPAHASMRPGELRLVTFKWNVHTQGRTAHHKYQAEIVHGNPVWMSPETGRELSLSSGDLIEVTLRRPVGPGVFGADEDAVTVSFQNEVRFVPGVAPRTLAVSHHLGHWQLPPLGNGEVDGAPVPGHEGMDPARADPDLDDAWWTKARGGIGTGVFVNDALPLSPTPLSGGQAWYDGVCTVRKVSRPG